MTFVLRRRPLFSGGVYFAHSKYPSIPPDAVLLKLSRQYANICNPFFHPCRPNSSWKRPYLVPGASAGPETSSRTASTEQLDSYSQLTSSFSRTSLALALALAAVGAGFLAVRKRESKDGPSAAATDRHLIAGDSMTAPAEIPPGRPGNLTAEQEEKLKKMWSLLLKICHVGPVDNGDVSDKAESIPIMQASPAPAESNTEKTHKKRRSFFSRRRGETESESSAPGTPSSAGLDTPPLKNVDQDDKYGQTKEFYHTLASQTPETIRATVWSMVKHDNPDALLLRFLRARKWDVDKALAMMISTMNWRATEMHVDDDIMKNGEGAAALAEKSNDVDADAKQMGHDFLAQMRMGKSFLHGSDKAGRPICFVRVRLHRQGEHSEPSLERNTVYLIETARLLLKPPVDTAVCLFSVITRSSADPLHLDPHIRHDKLFHGKHGRS